MTDRKPEELMLSDGLPSETPIEVGGDHRLADPEPPKAMLAACEQLTKSSLKRVDS